MVWKRAYPVFVFYEKLKTMRTIESISTITCDIMASWLNKMIKKAHIDAHKKIASFLTPISKISFFRHKIVRYLFSGGAAAFVDLGILFVLTHYAKFWYLFSAVIAFLFAFMVSFTLQKFWTFEDHSTDGYGGQIRLYFIISLVNLCLNTLLLYGAVDFIGIHYMLSQILVSGIIAVVSFFVYRKFVFKTKAK